MFSLVILGSLGFRVVSVLDSNLLGVPREEPEQACDELSRVVRDSDPSSTQTPKDPIFIVARIAKTGNGPSSGLLAMLIASLCKQPESHGPPFPN